MAAPPPTLKEIYSLIPVAEAAAIYNKAGLSADIRNAIDSGDPDYLQMMLAIVLEMTLSAHRRRPAGDALAAHDGRSDVERHYRRPSIAAAAGFGTITAAQVQAAMNS